MTDDLVADYLARLERAAAALPADRRRELLEEIGEHIGAARAAGAAADEAAVRTLLDRLGPPEEIVAAAREDLPGWGARPTRTAPRGTGHELAAVLLLTLGSFVPVVGWLAGVALLWTSRLWQVREKVLGTLVVPLGPGGVLLAGAFLPLGLRRCQDGAAGGMAPPPPPPVLPAPPGGGGSVVVGGEAVTCSVTEPDWLGIALLVLVVVAPLVVAAVLLRTARRRAAEQPVVVAEEPTASGSPWGGLELAAVLGLGLGGMVLPVLGSVVGLLLACTSRRWERGDKLVAAVLLVVPGALGFPGVPGLASVPGFGALGLFFGLLLGGVAAAAYLAVVLSRRAALRPA